MNNQTSLPKPADAEQESGKGLDETPCSASPVVLIVTLNTCKDCRHLDHSGAFTPGGARQICGAAGKRNAPAGDPEPWHWKHRVIEDLSATPPTWCPLRHGVKY